MRRLLAMFKARLLETVRDRGTLTWNLFFAPLLVICMATVFSVEPQAVLKAGVLGDAPLTAATNSFLVTDATQFQLEPDEAKAIAKVQRHSLDLLLDLRTQPIRYWMNIDSAKGRLLQSLLKAQHPEAQLQPVTGAKIRYSDWLVPGLLGVNVMFSSLFAIGPVVVRYRKSGYLKRLHGTPLHALEFVGAQLLACLILIVAVAAGEFAACNLILHLRMEGSYFNLLLVTSLGSMSMIAMSLLISARIYSEELSSGLLNLLSWPMLILSGVFFSLDGTPASIRAAAELFPLTQMLDAARAVMLDGAGLADIARPLVILAVMTSVFLALGARLFRWSADH